MGGRPSKKEKEAPKKEKKSPNVELQTVVSHAERRGSEKRCTLHSRFKNDWNAACTNLSPGGGKVVNLVISGDGGVGCSASSIMFTSGRFVDGFDPTIEEHWRNRINIEGTPLVLEILDGCETQDLSSINYADRWYRAGDSFLFVYDITSMQSFKNLEPLISRMEGVHGLHASQLPWVLMGNKLDLESQRRVPTSEGQKLAKRYGVPFFETSAKTCTNILEAIFTAVMAYALTTIQDKGRYIMVWESLFWEARHLQEHVYHQKRIILTSPSSSPSPGEDGIIPVFLEKGAFLQKKQKILNNSNSQRKHKRLLCVGLGRFFLECLQTHPILSSSLPNETMLKIISYLGKDEKQQMYCTSKAHLARDTRSRFLFGYDFPKLTHGSKLEIVDSSEVKSFAAKLKADYVEAHSPFHFVDMMETYFLSS